MAPLRALCWKQGIPRGKALTTAGRRGYACLAGTFCGSKDKKKRKKKIGTRKETEGSGKAKFLFTLTVV